MRKPIAALTAGAVVASAQYLGSRCGPALNNPGTAAWYASLRKPSFTPPGAVFGVAWTGLDILLGYAGYRLMTSKPSPSRNVALAAWASNLIGIAGFSWVLFGRRRLDEALGVTAGMVVTASATTATAVMVDRKAAYASLPLLVWVAFAAVLQEEVWRRNA